MSRFGMVDMGAPLMRMVKPTLLDDRRPQTVLIDQLLPPSMTFCGHFRVDNLSNLPRLLHNFSTAGGHVMWRSSVTMMTFTARRTGTNKATDIAFVPQLGVPFFAAGWVGPGTQGIQINAARVVEGSGIAYSSGTNGQKCTIMGHSNDGQASATLEGAGSDIRWYNRILVEAELNSIRLGEGGDGIVDGLIGMLRCANHRPTATLGEDLFWDWAKPSRAWNLAGTGTDLVWEGPSVNR